MIHDRYCRGRCCKPGTLSEHRANARALFRIRAACIGMMIGFAMAVVARVFF